MTECITDPIDFSSVSRKKIQADFHGGKLTSDAGTLLLREVDRRLGLIDQLNDSIPDPRNQALVIHQQRTLLAQRIFGIALGYEDLNDHQTLRDDPLFQTITERGLSDEQPLASPPTSVDWRTASPARASSPSRGSLSNSSSLPMAKRLPRS